MKVGICLEDEKTIKKVIVPLNLVSLLKFKKNQMDDQELVQHVFEKLKNGYLDYQIDDFLNYKDVDKSKQASIKESAYSLLLKYRLSYLPKQNKNKFIAFVTFSVLVFIVFFLVLPRMNIATGVFPLAVFGAIAFAFFLFMAYVYYKTWEPEFIELKDKPEIDWKAVLVLLPMPGIIFYFIISWLFSSASENILKETQEDAVGTVLRGTAYEGKRIQHAEITVSFETKQGEKIVTTEDISTYEFKEFYVGQQVNLIYSSTNPKNIDLLISADAIKTYKDTQEREIRPDDLFYLMNVESAEMKQELDRIKFGWVYDSTEQFWVNEKHNLAIKIENNVLTYVSRDFLQFPLLLERAGFKLSKETEASIKNEDEIVSSLLKQTADKVYIKGNLSVSVQKIKTDENSFQGMSLITVMKTGNK